MQWVLSDYLAGCRLKANAWCLSLTIFVHFKGALAKNNTSMTVKIYHVIWITILLYSTPRILNYYILSHHQHTPINPQYTAVCPVIWSLSVSLGHWVSAVTGRLRSTLTCWQTRVESRYHPVFILAVSNTRTKPTLYVYTHRLTVTACPRISLLDSS